MTTPAMKSIFDRAWETVGGTDPRVVGCRRDAGEEEVDVLHSADTPEPGQTSYATIGMYLGETGNLAGSLPLRVELLGVCTSGVSDFANMLASCAFNVLTGEYGIQPGNIFPDIVAQYRPDSATAHMLFVPVFSWPEPDNLEVDGVLVTWLQAVPVTQTEFAFARRNGVEALQDRLEAADADVADLDRASVV